MSSKITDINHINVYAREFLYFFHSASNEGMKQDKIETPFYWARKISRKEILIMSTYETFIFYILCKKYAPCMFLKIISYD